MRIAFVYTPFHHNIYEENVFSVTHNFGVYPPLSVLYAAAVAEKSGYDVIVIDAFAEKLEKEQVLHTLRKFEPNLLVFHAHSTYTFHQTREWAEYLKRKMRLPTLVGGFNLKIYPKETMHYPVFDYGILGSLSKYLPGVLEAILNNKNMANVEGIAYRRGKKVIFNSPKESSTNLEELPFPGRHLVNNELYYSFISQKKNFTIMLTSMGCPMRCNFCEEGKTPFVSRSPGHVIKEIEECYHRYGIREIDFFDVSFTNDMKRAEEICKLIISKKLNIIWSVRARVDRVDKKLLKLMKRAGCERIYYGIETGSQEILDKMKKGITLEKVRKTVKDTKDCGIRVLGYFMTGCPGETEKTLEETVNYACSLNLDYAQFSKTLAKPKTELHTLLIEKTGRDYWSDMLLKKDLPKVLPMPWTTISPDRIHRLTKHAYFKFYFRPDYIMGTILKMRSFHEFERAAKAAFEMIFISK